MTVDIPDKGPNRYKVNVEIIVEAFDVGEAVDKVIMLLDDVEREVESHYDYPDNIFKYTTGEVTQLR